MLNTKITEVKNEVIKTKVITNSINCTANTDTTYTVDYSTISGEIVGSVLTGCVCTASNDEITKLIPYTVNTTETNKVSSVTVNSKVTQQVFISVLVFYKETAT